MIVTEPAPTADACSPQQRREMIAWLAAQGIPNRSVWSVELDLIDCPLVRVTRIVRNEDGLAMIDPARPNWVLMETTEHAQTLDPPSWWQPDTPPT